jgi:hypothetical protein
MILPVGGVPVVRLNKVDVDCIRQEFESIRNQVQWQLAGVGEQTGINYKDDDEASFRHTSIVAPRSGGINPNILREGAKILRRFTLYNPEYDNTLIKSILEHFDCFGTRIMTVEPGRCYNWHNDRSFEHKDTAYRLHIPIYSDPGNYFAFFAGMFRLEPGWVYIVDSTRSHTFFNASKEHRYHVVGNTDMTKKMDEVFAIGAAPEVGKSLDKAFFSTAFSKLNIGSE